MSKSERNGERESERERERASFNGSTPPPWGRTCICPGRGSHGLLLLLFDYSLASNCAIHKSMNLKYEPASEPLQSFTNIERVGVSERERNGERQNEQRVRASVVHWHRSPPLGQDLPLQSLRRGRQKSIFPQSSCFQKWKACPDTLLDEFTPSNTLARWICPGRGSHGFLLLLPFDSFGPRVA